MLYIPCIIPDNSGDNPEECYHACYIYRTLSQMVVIIRRRSVMMHVIYKPYIIQIIVVIIQRSVIMHVIYSEVYRTLSQIVVVMIRIRSVMMHVIYNVYYPRY